MIEGNNQQGVQNSMNINENEVQTENNVNPLFQMFTGVLAFTIGVFVCGSLATYSSTDPSLNVASNSVSMNIFGTSGAYFSDILTQLLGWSGWILGIGLLVGGIKRTLFIGQPDASKWWLGVLLIPISAACFAVLPQSSTDAIATNLGGMIGIGFHASLAMPLKAFEIANADAIAGAILGVVAFWIALFISGLKFRDVVTTFKYSGILVQALYRVLKSILKGSVGVFKVVLKLIPPKREPKELFPSVTNYQQDEPTISNELVSQQEDTEPFEDSRIDSSVIKPSKTDVQPPAKPSISQPKKRYQSFKLPPISLLDDAPERQNIINKEELLDRAQRLSEVLEEFGIQGTIREVRPGPVVTLFELEPAAGVKSARVIALADDVARSMSATAARIAVVSGKNAIGIELPNEDRETVYFRTLLGKDAYRRSQASLPMALGEDIGGSPIVVDLAKMPHLLIAGTTGSGKSVGVNAMILSLLFKLTPEECRFIMIDPKMLELSVYQEIPHLLAPVVTDPKKAVNALKWTVREMEKRYELMSKAGVRNLKGFNEKAAKLRETGEKMSRQVRGGASGLDEEESLPTDHIPNIVVVIDEMADLMIVAGKEIEGCIQRLAQMARAAGIHLITATQRPSVDVITGTIKANFPTRISYMVTTKIDSRTIIGEQGAEQLLGMGDLLYLAPGGRPKRMHGPFVSDGEVEEVANWLRSQGEADYRLEVLEEVEDESPVMDAMFGGSSDDDEDDLYTQAKLIIVRDGRASTSYIQRRLKIGYNKAASLIERLEENNVVSAPNHAGKREILVNREDH